MQTKTVQKWTAIYVFQLYVYNRNWNIIRDLLGKFFGYDSIFSDMSVAFLKKQVFQAFRIYDTIYQPLRSGRIWHKVSF